MVWRDFPGDDQLSTARTDAAFSGLVHRRDTGKAARRRARGCYDVPRIPQKGQSPRSPVSEGEVVVDPGFRTLC